MTPNDKDTDPSTPQSLRPSGDLPEMENAPKPGRSRPSTDPGVGPPLTVPVDSPRPRGIVVPPPSVQPAPGRGPSSSPAGGKKDSVELLLEGMTGPLLDRTKTTPQSDGEASAAYHAKHGLHAAITGRERGPKVEVERSTVAARNRASSVAPLSGSIPTEPTPRPPRDLGWRMVVATCAGLLVVLAIYVLLRVSTPPNAAERPVDPTASLQRQAAVTLVTPTIPEAVAAPPPAATTETSAAASEPSPTPAPALLLAPPQPKQKPRRKPSSPPAATATTPGLGEFKTTF